MQSPHRATHVAAADAADGIEFHRGGLGHGRPRCILRREHKLLPSTLQRLAENNVLVEATGGPTGSSLHHSATNQRISCSAPSAYMAELRDEPGFPMQAVLSSHLIPHGPDSGLWSDDYERFLLQRLERVGAAIAKVASPQAFEGCTRRRRPCLAQMHH